MTLAQQKDIGYGLKTVAAVAGSTVDSEVNGGWIDRQGFLSAILALAVTPTVAEGETVTFLGNWQDADDISGGGAADFGDAVTSVTIGTGTTGADPLMSLVRNAGLMKVNLTSARRYVRAQITVGTSGSGTAVYGAVYVLGGSDTGPV